MWRYLILGIKNRPLDKIGVQWALRKLERFSGNGLKVKIPRSTRLRGIFMSIVGFNLGQR